MTAKPLSLRILKLILAVWWWGLVAGTLISSIWIFLASSEDLDYSIWGYASEIDTSSFSAKDRDGQALTVSFEDPVLIKFELPEGTRESGGEIGQRVVTALILVPFFLASLYFVKQLRDIVRTIEEHNPFAEENAGRVRAISFLIILFLIVDCVGRFAMSAFADSTVLPQGFNLNGRIKINEGLLVVAVAMLVLSEVFRHGSRMREEQSLTV